MSAFQHRQMILGCYMEALFLREQTRENFKREWMMDDDAMDLLGVKSVPKLIFNMIVSHQIHQQIGFPEKGLNEFFWTGNVWLLDVPDKYSHTGVILPVMDPGRRHIKCLQVFRHAKDDRPFIVSKNSFFSHTREPATILPAVARLSTNL